MTMSLRERYLAAQDFDTMLSAATKNADLWAAVWRRAEVPTELLERAASIGGRWHLLVLSADWCGDAVNIVPVIARLAHLAPNIDLRILDRDANLDIMDAHRTGTSRSIPLFIALDESFVERGWWGPRPTVLQEFVLGDGQSLEKAERYREVRTWYARDRGVTSLGELITMLESAAAMPAG